MRFAFDLLLLLCLAIGAISTVQSVEDGFQLPKLEHVDANIQSVWTKFKSTYGFIYNSTKEELHRLQIFTNHVKMILKHNLEHDLGLHTFRLGVNKFAAMVWKLRFSSSNINEFVLVLDEPRISPTIQWLSSFEECPIEIECIATNAHSRLTLRHSACLGGLA